MNIKTAIFGICLLTFATKVKCQDKAVSIYNEPYRPQVHFSPKEKWMNDPNGMVYNKGIYHLFYQFYPNGTTWGSMHWGHAESKDMIHWQQKAIALYPDSLGYIFSGSAVVDANNTSGFGKNGQVPLVAIFTSHDPKGEKAGKDNFQNESIAYSLDNGSTWTKYSGNPVLKNPGIRDFRDPKVSWYAAGKKWVMTLATKDRVTFFSSTNLKDWKKESEFGQALGAHGGVWECPDLFPLTLHGKTYWVLLASINPGGPNGGSATQYFIGQFDGHNFTETANNKGTKWIDYGPDDYAGVTWSNTGSRRVFLGWMSNWLYAGEVPTGKWRSAMTTPRELSLCKVNGQMLLSSKPVKELSNINTNPTLIKNLEVTGIVNATAKLGKLPGQYIFKMKMAEIKNYKLILSNYVGQQLVIGFNKKRNCYYIDRSASGQKDFNKGFAAVHYAPRLSLAKKTDLTLIVDAASVELFGDDGLTVMTSIFFPDKPYNKLEIQSNKFMITKLEMVPLKSIW